MNRQDWRDLVVVTVLLMMTVDVLSSPWFVLLDIGVAAVVLSVLAKIRFGGAHAKAIYVSRQEGAGIREGARRWLANDDNASVRGRFHAYLTP